MRWLDHRMTARFNEADLIFRPHGELWCVSRTKLEPNGNSLLYRSRLPYTKWGSPDLGALIHAPTHCESGGKAYMAGRRDPTAPWIPQRSPSGNTGIFLLEDGEVTPVFALPCDGDCLLLRPRLAEARLAGEQILFTTPLPERGVMRREEVPSPFGPVVVIKGD